MAALNLRNLTGAAVLLGDEIGRGGEAAVYRVVGSASLLAKIYLQPPSSIAAAKLGAMVEVGRQSTPIKSFLAWPHEILVDAQTRSLRGFLMQHAVGHREFHELYSPQSRNQFFVLATFRFLVHVAWNVAAAFREIHKAGIVIGDVNARNLLVSQKGTSFFIDCDSMGFQLRSQTFECSPVGMEEFLPAELHRDLRGITRVQNHDLFGLAVLVFHLLFCGRHPYSGRLAHSGHGELPSPGEAIKAGDFAYARQPRGRLRPVPGHPTLEIVGDRCADLFERAFCNSKAPIRPSATEWFDALGELRKNLKNCAQSEDHAYLNTLRHCPWCSFLRSQGVDLFTGSARRLDSWSPDSSRLPQLLQDYASAFARLIAELNTNFQPPAAVFPAPFSIAIAPHPTPVGARPVYEDFRIKMRAEPAMMVVTTTPPALLQYPIRPNPPLMVLQKQAPRLTVPDSFLGNLTSVLSGRHLGRWGSLVAIVLITTGCISFNRYGIGISAAIAIVGVALCLLRLLINFRRGSDAELSSRASSHQVQKHDDVAVQLELARFEIAEANWRREFQRVQQYNDRKMDEYKRQKQEAETAARARFEEDQRIWREEQIEAERHAQLRYQMAESKWQQAMMEYRRQAEARLTSEQRARAEVRRLQSQLVDATRNIKVTRDRLMHAIDDLRRTLADILQASPAEMQRQVDILFSEYRTKVEANLGSSRVLEGFLMTIPISKQIVGIGGGDIYLSLLRGGIRTAADCHFNRLVTIPKIGAARANVILGWKNSLIASWQKGQSGHPAQTSHQLNREYGQKNRQLEQKMSAFTRRIMDAIEDSQIGVLRNACATAFREHMQCEADLSVCPDIP